MSKNIVETLVGAIVILIAGAFLSFAYFTTDIVGIDEDGYNIFAKFDRADGLNPGSDIKIGGVKVGKVADLTLDPKSYQAIVRLRIKHGVELPIDSTAEIIGNGLLGEKYVAIIPGSETDYIANNGAVEFTQSSISLESLIGKFIFDGAKNKDSSNATKTEQQGNRIKIN